MATKHLGRFRCTDTLGVAHSRIRDQEEPEPDESDGELICRLMEGRDGNFMGHDAKGRALRIRRAKDGALEIRHLGEPAGDEADPAFGAGASPDVVGTYPGGGGDPAKAARASATGDAMAKFAQTGRSEFHMPGLAAYQKRLDDHYGNSR
jgi:hypothetical protein